MGHFLDDVETPESESDLRSPAFPLGMLAVVIDEAEVPEGGIGDNGIQGMNLRCTVQKPSEFAEQSYWGTLWLGNKNDPNGAEARTRKGRGFKLLKLLCEKTEVDPQQKLEVLAEELRGEKIIIHNRPRTYQGVERNDIAWFFAVGEVRPGVTDEEEAKPAGRKASRRATNGSGREASAPKRAKQKARPPVEQEEEFGVDELEE
jgi:hypothetical protein